MKNFNIISIGIILLFSASCVQKSQKQTIVLNLDVSGIKNIKTVGIRGEGQPLSWDKDLEMKAVVKDSLYTITGTVETGYKFSQIKFTVNGDFELKDRPNRRVVFSDSGKTIFNAKFDIENK